MRTTVTLDPDVERLLKAEERRTGESFKRVLNRAVRRGLTAGPSSTSTYEAPVIESALMPGVDPAGFNRLADELETEAIKERL